MAKFISTCLYSKCIFIADNTNTTESRHYSSKQSVNLSLYPYTHCPISNYSAKNIYYALFHINYRGKNTCCLILLVLFLFICRSSFSFSFGWVAIIKPGQPDGSHLCLFFSMAIGITDIFLCFWLPSGSITGQGCALPWQYLPGQLGLSLH